MDITKEILSTYCNEEFVELFEDHPPPSWSIINSQHYGLSFGNNVVQGKGHEYLRKVDTIPGIPSHLEEFCVPQDLTEIFGDQVLGWISRWTKTEPVFLEDLSGTDYSIRLVDREFRGVWRDGLRGIGLYGRRDGKEYPLALTEFEFYDSSSFVMVYTQGVRASKGNVNWDVPGFLRPLRWRELLMDAGYRFASSAYSLSGSSEQKVYVVPARLQRWLNSHHAPEHCPFDIKRAKMAIDRPARNAGFRQTDSTGMLYKLVA